jgi:hypothetical protein
MSFKSNVYRISFCISFSCSISVFIVASRFEVDCIRSMNSLSKLTSLFILRCFLLIYTSYTFLDSSVSTTASLLSTELALDVSALTLWKYQMSSLFSIFLFTSSTSFLNRYFFNCLLCFLISLASCYRFSNNYWANPDF